MANRLSVACSSSRQWGIPAFVVPSSSAATTASSHLALIGQDTSIRHYSMSSSSSCGTKASKEQVRQPNRFTTYFQGMKETCPDAIQTYATCVQNAFSAQSGDQPASSSASSSSSATNGQHQPMAGREAADGDDDHRSVHRICQDEFEQVKDCFRLVRRNIRAQQL